MILQTGEVIQAMIERMAKQEPAQREVTAQEGLLLSICATSQVMDLAPLMRAVCDLPDTTRQIAANGMDNVVGPKHLFTACMRSDPEKRIDCKFAKPGHTCLALASKDLAARFLGNDVRKATTGIKTMNTGKCGPEERVILENAAAATTTEDEDGEDNEPESGDLLLKLWQGELGMQTAEQKAGAIILPSPPIILAPQILAELGAAQLKSGINFAEKQEKVPWKIKPVPGKLYQDLSLFTAELYEDNYLKATVPGATWQEKNAWALNEFHTGSLLVPRELTGGRYKLAQAVIRQIARQITPEGIVNWQQFYNNPELLGVLCSKALLALAGGAGGADDRAAPLPDY